MATTLGTPCDLHVAEETSPGGMAVDTTNLQAAISSAAFDLPRSEGKRPASSNVIAAAIRAKTMATMPGAPCDLRTVEEAVSGGMAADATTFQIALAQEPRCAVFLPFQRIG